MKTVIQGKRAKTTLDDLDRVVIRSLLHQFGPHADVPVLGAYSKLSQEELWWILVQQICVMGSARGMEALQQDAARMDAFRAKTSLRAWRRTGFDREYMSKCLKEFKVTRFHQKAATKLTRLLEEPGATKKKRIVLLDKLPRTNEVEAIREKLMARCPVFGRKSASDFMITVGLSHDVIALDQRVVGALRRYLNYNLPFARVQASESVYASVEAALRDASKEAGRSLAVLDRVLFRFTGMSAIEFAVNVNGKHRAIPRASR